jgi:hypothetical protein
MQFGLRVDSIAALACAGRDPSACARDDMYRNLDFWSLQFGGQAGSG